MTTLETKPSASFFSPLSMTPVSTAIHGDPTQSRANTRIAATSSPERVSG